MIFIIMVYFDKLKSVTAETGEKMRTYSIYDGGKAYGSVNDFAKANPRAVKVFEVSDGNDKYQAVIFKKSVLLAERGGCEALPMQIVKRSSVLVGSSLFDSVKDMKKFGFNPTAKEVSFLEAYCVDCSLKTMDRPD